MNHPTYETLINYIEGRLAGNDLAHMEDHLAGPCQQCGATIARLRIILETIASDETSLPPPDVLNKAVLAFRNRPAPPSRSPLRVLADLMFDSRMQLSAAAMRGAAHSRQMLFATEQVDIDLNITAEHREHTLAGQILDREQAEIAPAAFVILQDEAGTVVRDMELDSLGQFTFRNIPSGVYELVADLGSQEVAITGIALGND